MFIDGNIDLAQLAERMGDSATIEEARALRKMLIEEGWWGKDTADIPEAEWLMACETAVRFAAE